MFCKLRAPCPENQVLLLESQKGVVLEETDDLSLGFLIYKTGKITDYRNVNITTDNVVTAFLYSS